MEAGPKKWFRKWWGVLLIVFFGLFLILATIFGLYIFSLATGRTAPPAGTVNKNKTFPVQDTIGDNKDYWTGSASPIINIVEFADYACPYCRQSFPTIREIGAKYQKDVKIIFRDYPVVKDYSADLALAARCAGEQGLFWPMHDQLFINQGVSTRDELISLARGVGAKVEQFTACFDSKKYQAQVEKDYQDGLALGVTGTPTFFLEGVMISGNIPRDYFNNLIDETIKTVKEMNENNSSNQ